MSSLGRQTVDRPTYNCVRCGRNLVETGDINLDKTSAIFSRSCKMCKDTIFGVGTCWKCNDCRYYYHETCVPPKPNLQHSFYPAVEYFEFLTGPGTAGSKRCVACYQLIEGCLYVSKNASPEHVQHVPSHIYMHPNCLVNLKASASSPTIENHMQKMGLLQQNGGPVDNRLELNCKMSLSPGVECIFCNKPERGWVFTVGKSSTKFECHVSCLREKLDKYCNNEILKEHAAGSTYDEKTYFQELSRWKLEGSATAVAGLAIPVVFAGLDVVISAFVGAPLLSLSLSFFLGMAEDKMKSKLGRPRRN